MARHTRKTSRQELELKTQTDSKTEEKKTSEMKTNCRKLTRSENRTECVKNLFIDEKRKFKITEMKTK